MASQNAQVATASQKMIYGAIDESWNDGTDWDKWDIISRIRFCRWCMGCTPEVQKVAFNAYRVDEAEYYGVCSAINDHPSVRV